MKELFEQPELEIIELGEDIITTSNRSMLGATYCESDDYTMPELEF